MYVNVIKSNKLNMAIGKNYVINEQKKPTKLVLINNFHYLTGIKKLYNVQYSVLLLVRCCNFIEYLSFVGILYSSSL